MRSRGPRRRSQSSISPYARIVAPVKRSSGATTATFKWTPKPRNTPLIGAEGARFPQRVAERVEPCQLVEIERFGDDLDRQRGHGSRRARPKGARCRRACAARCRGRSPPRRSRYGQRVMPWACALCTRPPSSASTRSAACRSVSPANSISTPLRRGSPSASRGLGRGRKSGGLSCLWRDRHALAGLLLRQASGPAAQGAGDGFGCFEKHQMAAVEKLGLRIRRAPHERDLVARVRPTWVAPPPLRPISARIGRGGGGGGGGGERRAERGPAGGGAGAVDTVEVGRDVALENPCRHGPKRPEGRRRRVAPA